MSSVIGKIGPFLRPRLPSVGSIAEYSAIDNTSALTTILPVRPQLPRSQRDRMRRSADNGMRALITQFATDLQIMRRSGTAQNKQTFADTSEDDRRPTHASVTAEDQPPFGPAHRPKPHVKPLVRSNSLQKMLRLLL